MLILMMPTWHWLQMTARGDAATYCLAPKQTPPWKTWHMAGMLGLVMPRQIMTPTQQAAAPGPQSDNYYLTRQSSSELMGAWVEGARIVIPT